MISKTQTEQAAAAVASFRKELIVGGISLQLADQLTLDACGTILFRVYESFKSSPNARERGTQAPPALN